MPTLTPWPVKQCDFAKVAPIVSKWMIQPFADDIRLREPRGGDQGDVGGSPPQRGAPPQSN